MRKELEFIIQPDGDVQIRTIGIKGQECLEEVRPIQQALGVVKEQRLTSEYYEEQPVETHERARAGNADNHRR